MPDAFIYDAVRTPRGKGKASGALYTQRPIDLAATAAPRIAAAFAARRLRAAA